MSTKTPNDLLNRRITRLQSGAIAKPSEKERLKKGSSTRLKDVFINSKQREELMIACSKGDLPRVTHLLEEKKAGLNPDLIRDSKLRTPLLVACAAGQADVVRQLIRFGADVNNAMGDIAGNKPLDLAVISNNVETVLVLLEAGAKVSAFDPTIQADDGLPLPVRMRAASRTPLDLANSRLDLLIKYTEQNQVVKEETMNQVQQIIKLLGHFLPPTGLDELNELTDRLSSVEIGSNEKLQSNSSKEDIFVMKSIRDVISKIQL